MPLYRVQHHGEVSWGPQVTVLCSRRVELGTGLAATWTYLKAATRYVSVLRDYLTAGEYVAVSRLSKAAFHQETAGFYEPPHDERMVIADFVPSPTQRVSAAKNWAFEVQAFTEMDARALDHIRAGIAVMGIGVIFYGINGTSIRGFLQYTKRRVFVGSFGPHWRYKPCGLGLLKNFAIHKHLAHLKAAVNFDLVSLPNVGEQKKENFKEDIAKFLV